MVCKKATVECAIKRAEIYLKIAVVGRIKLKKLRELQVSFFVFQIYDMSVV